MKVGTIEQVAEVALTAATQAVTDASAESAKPNEVGARNEHWIQSHVGIQVNDLLRRIHHGQKEGAASGDVFVTFETTGSWLDDFLGYEAGRGRGYHVGARQRFDLCFWSRTKPVGLLEIKHDDGASWGKNSDIKKIRNAVLRWPKLDFSMLLVSSRYAKFDAERHSLAVDDFIKPFRRAYSKKLHIDVHGTMDRMAQGSRCTWDCFVFRRRRP